MGEGLCKGSGVKGAWLCKGSGVKGEGLCKRSEVKGEGHSIEIITIYCSSNIDIK